MQLRILLMIARITSYATIFTCLFLGGCIISGKTVATGDGLSVTANLLGTQTTVSTGTGGVGGVVEGVTGLVGNLGGDILYVAGNAPLLSQGSTVTAPLNTAGGLVEVVAPSTAGGGGSDALAKAADTSVLTAYAPGDQGAESLRIAQEAQDTLGGVAGAAGAPSGGGATGSSVGGAVGGATGAVGSTVSQILGSAGGGSGGLLGGLLP
jgi:hypothetical protein